MLYMYFVIHILSVLLDTNDVILRSLAFDRYRECMELLLYIFTFNQNFHANCPHFPQDKAFIRINFRIYWNVLKVQYYWFNIKLSTFQTYVKYKKRFLLRCIHHFKLYLFKE